MSATSEERDFVAASANCTPDTARRSRSAHRRRDSLSMERRKSADAGSTGGAVSLQSAKTGYGTSDESESTSRKSSMSSGHRKGVAAAGHRDSKQFAVTFFVSESDKTKLVDMIHKAKNVISKKVEKVMGRKGGGGGSSGGTTVKQPSPTQSTSNVSSAPVLISILENWVSQEEEKGREDEAQVAELIESQMEQMERFKSEGMVDPPVRYIPTVVSPVPEEEEEEEEEMNKNEDDKEKVKDISVQEVVEGETTYLRPPPVSSIRFTLSPSSSGMLSPRRSLSPCENVPRPHFSAHLRKRQDDYPLRRPSSHYDESCQAASSRPCSPRTTTESRPTSPDAVILHFPDPPMKREDEYYDTEPYPASEVPDESSRPFLSSMIQRPQSMTVPIGGVWRPDDTDYEHHKLFSDDEDEDDDTEKPAPESATEDAPVKVEPGKGFLNVVCLLQPLTSYLTWPSLTIAHIHTHLDSLTTTYHASFPLTFFFSILFCACHAHTTI